jgi:hypothetical protein
MRYAFGFSLCLWIQVAACGGSSSPPTPNGPNVTLNIPDTQVAGTYLSLQVTYSGCAQTSSLTLLNNGAALKALPVGTGNSSSVQLALSDIPFKAAGIAAQLLLSAQLTCLDGQSATSTAVPVSFFPAQALYANADGSPYVPDVFYAEGSGSGVTFVGCALDANNNPELVRVNLSGQMVQQNDLLATLSLPCNDTTWFTSSTVGGVRWAVTPNQTAFAFNTNLDVVLQAQADEGFSCVDAGTYPDAGAIPRTHTSVVVVPPLGSFFGVDNLGGALLATQLSAGQYAVMRFPVAAGSGPYTPPTWCTPVSLPQSAPQMNASGQVVLITAASNGTNASDLAQRLNASTGVPVGTTTLWTFPYSQLPGQAYAGLSTDGNTAYLPELSATTSGSFTLEARSVSAATLDWQTALNGVPEAFLPSGDKSYVAAITNLGAYFLGASNGASVGLGQTGSLPALAPGLSASGQQLGVMSVQPGRSSDFYLLDGTGAGLPVEVVATDNPDAGELFRFTVSASTGVNLAFDDSGQLWLRLGNDLLQALPLATYRQLRGQ